MLENTKPISDFDCDENSDISSLQCGSIPPNTAYDPVRDPRNFTFSPPFNIVIKGKVQVPEWLRIDRYDSPSRSASNIFSPLPKHSKEGKLLRQVSWSSSRLSTRPDHLSPKCHYPLGGDDWEQRSRKASPDLCKGAKSTTSTHLTIPTLLSGDEDASMVLLEVGVIPELPTVHRLSIFHRRKRKITLRPPCGCLA